MSAMQRNKGRSGEQELARLLRDSLGINITRNLIQSREGGYDLLGIDEWAIEVKRAAKSSLSPWWDQTVKQACMVGKKPLLAYRLDRREWKFIIHLSALSNSFEISDNDLQWTCEIGLSALVTILKR